MRDAILVAALVRWASGGWCEPLVCFMTLYLEVANVETETHSVADLRVSKINNYNVKVSQVEDCKLTGFTELTGLCVFFAIQSTAQTTPRPSCESVSMNV